MGLGGCDDRSARFSRPRFRIMRTVFSRDIIFNSGVLATIVFKPLHTLLKTISIRHLPALIVLGSLAMLPSMGFADELNLPVGVTDISRNIYDLHMLILWVCVAIGVIVFGAMAISMFAHRRSRGFQARKFHDNLTLEIVWTIIPFLVLVGLAAPSTVVLLRMYDTGGEDLTIEVRGYQWKWQYKYLDDDRNEAVSFFSSLATPRDEISNTATKGEYYLLEVDKPLVIPTNRKVRFLVTAEDVIHSWWVPDFGIKRDAVPGLLNDMWTIVNEPGVYRGQCTELCGKDHGFMPIVVNAVPPEEFELWYDEELELAEARRAALSKTFTDEELMVEGERVYNTFCVSCHMPSGAGIPPIYPTLIGSEVVMGPREEHLRIVYEGVPGSSMQAFGKQLDAAQLAAVVHYERHSWGNDTGDMTQPRDVIALMD